MESTAIIVKEEDTASVVADATATSTATNESNPISVTDEIVPPIKLDKEMIMTTDDIEQVVNSELAVLSTSATSNKPKTEEDQLNIAMASTTISTNEVDEIKLNLDEKVLDQQQKPVTDTVEKDTINNEKSDINLDISIKTKSESDEINNSTIGSVFEDAVEYIINDEEDNVVKEQPQDVIQEENVPDDESSSQQEVEGGDVDEESGEENKDPAAPSEPVVPVPVDDDTNDPQYIPRRGRFYEHDDRMAYSTTSSEGSESDNGYEEDSADDDEVSDRRRIRRRHTGIKKQKSVTPIDTVENAALEVGDGTLSTKKVLAISKVAASTKELETSAAAEGIAKKLSVGSRKTRDLDALDKWTHDMYDENEQTRKSRDELLASYGYDIREESEAPRARRHHKYGRAATTKYTRSWQDTKAYTGAGSQQSMKVKRGGMARRNVGGPNKNINKSTSDEYTSEFPALDDTKKSKHNASTGSSAVVEASGQNHEQLKTLSIQNEDKKSVAPVIETSQTRHHIPSSRATSKHNTTSPTNRNSRPEQQNGGSSTSSPSTNNKNYFNRSSTESPNSKEKVAQGNRDSPSATANSNFFNRRSQQNSGGHNQHHNYKQQHFNSGQGGQGHNQQHQNTSPSVPRSRNFHQHHTSQQYNRDRYFSKGSAPLSSTNSNQHNYDQQHHSATPTTAGTGRTQHGGGHYQNYTNRQYENENQQIESPAPPTPVVRSSKRYSVQSRRELPDPVLNFGGISKTSQPQPPVPQQNGLVMQDQQMQPTPQQLQQQQPIQIHQQPPPPLQIQQYHQPLQQIHHGMVLDHNTGMMVMATADPSMYHHQMYATPQYATGVAPGPAAGNADDQNAAAAAAAAALQMLAAQAAVYQPVPTGATGVTSPPPGTQSLQQPETFMTTYYQPQQQPQQQPPPRRVNLAIPIVAPPPEPIQQQGNLKTNLSTSPPPTTASTN